MPNLQLINANNIKVSFGDQEVLTVLENAMLLVSDVNLLILDEPTNYMDIPSIEAIETLLREYEGTLIFVSHDMELIENVATKVYVVGKGKITEASQD